MKLTFHFVVSLAAWLAMLIVPAAAQQIAGPAAPDDMSSAPRATVVSDSSTAVLKRLTTPGLDCAYCELTKYDATGKSLAISG